jgi:anion-transporting  ArsA/GET3 family ATPase
VTRRPLDRRQLIIVTGKGGVGKTTLTAALGHVLAARGRNVLLVEIDPRENLHQLLGVPPAGGEVVEAAKGLWLQNLEPRREIEQLVREKLRVGALAKRVTASPVFTHFVEGAPGLKELAVLHHALRAVEAKQRTVDIVVLDAPATGHGVSLLAAPGLADELIGASTVGIMVGDVAELVADPERSAVVVGTLAEEMPVQEAIELISMLDRRLDRSPDLVVVNGVYPEVPVAQPGLSRGVAGAMSLWRKRRKVNEKEIARLTPHGAGAQIELPLFPWDPGPDLISAFVGALQAGLRELEL